MTARALSASSWKLVAIAALYLVLAAATAAARLPMSDEGWFGIPAWHLAFRGKLVNPVVVPVQAYHEGIDRKTYISPPAHFLELALAFRTAGFGLFQARVVSILWGLVALLAGARIVRTATGSEAAAVLAAGIAALDFGLLSGASNARADLPCFAAGLAGLALYLSLRTSSLSAALLAGNALVAAGGLLHPNGLCAFVSLQAATLALDRRRVKGREVLFALVPYAIGAIAWGSYVLQDLPTFEAQLLSVMTRAKEIGGHNTDVLLNAIGLGSGSAFVKAARLAPLVLLAILVLAAARSAVKSPAPGLRPLLYLCVWNVFFLVLFSPTKRYDYLLFATVPATLVLAAFLAGPDPRPRFRSPFWAAAVAVIVAANLARTASRVATNAYAREWRPVVNRVLGDSAPDEIVGAGREFFFGFAGRRTMVDDYYFGARTGRLAPWLIVGREEDPDPDALRFEPVADRYESVFANTFYEVFRLRPTAPATARP